MQCLDAKHLFLENNDIVEVTFTLKVELSVKNGSLAGAKMVYVP